MADLERCFYSKCLEPSSGRLTLETQALIPGIKDRAGFLYGQMDLRGGNNGIYRIKMRRGEGRRLMRQAIVHYPTALPRLTWLCVTSTAINNILTITLVAPAYAICQIAFSKVIPFSPPPAYSYSLYSFHLQIGCFCGIAVSAVLVLISRCNAISCEQISGPYSQVSTPAIKSATGHIGCLDGAAGALGIGQ